MTSTTAKKITIDRGKHLNQEPHTGHNRWHPDLEPIVVVGEGEPLVLETRDALDGYLDASSTAASFASVPFGAVHPLTGPVYVKGASPGDLLEVEFLDILPQPWAFSAIVPGMGFLRDLMNEPFLVHWQIADGFATSPQLPGVRIPGAPFMGVSGVAPSFEEVAAWTRREADAASRGGFVLPPNPDGAVPAAGAAATRRPADEPTTRERRQPRRQTAHAWFQTVSASQRRRRDVLDRRWALRAGRRRSVRHGN